MYHTLTKTLCATALTFGIGASVMADGHALSQKDIAVGIIQDGLMKADLDFVNKYVAENYIQHNPQAPDGRAGLIGFAQYLSASENKATIARVLEQDDMVALHVVYELGDQKMAAFDIFRFEDGIAVEHWDGLQPWVQDTVSGRSMIDGPTEVTDLDKTAENAAIVTGFVTDVLINGQFDKLTDYIGDQYLQHNPNIGDGLDGLGKFVGYLQSENIAFGYSKTHVTVAEGNFVLTQNEGIFGDTPTAFYDLFRVENGKIVEHWDVIQEIPTEMAHENGFF